MGTSERNNPLASCVHGIFKERYLLVLFNRATLVYVIVPGRSFDKMIAIAPGFSLVPAVQDLLALGGLSFLENLPAGRVPIHFSVLELHFFPLTSP